MMIMFPFASAGVSTTRTSESEPTLLKTLRQAHAFIAKLQKQAALRSSGARPAVVVSLSAQAAKLVAPADAQENDPVAQWHDALTDRQKADESGLAQIQEQSKEMQRARHDMAVQRLQQLLAQYRALRVLGSTKALAALAKEIKAAADEVAASGDGSGGNAAAADAGSLTPAASAAGIAATTVGAVAAAGSSGASSKAASLAEDMSAGASEESGGTAAASEALASASPSAGAPWSRPLIDQVAAAGAEARQRAEEALLVQQARAALGDIARLAKQEDEEKRRKGVTMPTTRHHAEAAPVSSHAPVSDDGSPTGRATEGRTGRGLVRGLDMTA